MNQSFEVGDRVEAQISTLDRESFSKYAFKFGHQNLTFKKSFKVLLVKTFAQDVCIYIYIYEIYFLSM